ncbi:MAG: D-alanyl-lipoteichoic acid biosynthesis protein DltB [Chloroflexi bacterium]|nr:D-alanyl-lipoteichoic acid biosynthesis protein DltB [Chloroflexota bacterium]
MIPYADFLYFGVTLYLVIPTLILGLIGWLPWRWPLIATLIMLVVQYWGSAGIQAMPAIREMYVLGAYAVMQWAIAVGFLVARGRGRSRWQFYSAVGLSLLPLVVAKVFPLLSPISQLGFLGISYVTFRALDVIFGIQDRAISRLAPDQYLTFLFFFPTISSGPIDRYRRFGEDFKRQRKRAEFLQDLDSAVHQVFTGFLYKFIVAKLIQKYWLDPAAAGTGVRWTLAYMYGYSLYLFFDFAGYSAFAIGFSYLFGIHTPENFRRPFLARDMRDFWNRWHLSLSFWFRDHVYMRFVLAATKGRWFKSRHMASHLGFLLSFGLMGLWHGTQPFYLLYGLYHAALLVWNDVFSRWNREHRFWGEGRIWTLTSVVITFHAICFGFLLFSGHIGPTWPVGMAPGR